MAAKQYYVREKKDSFVLGNVLLEAVISKKRGNLIGLTLKRKKFGLWNGWDGFLIIEDELKEKKFNDSRSPMTIRFRRGLSDEGLFVEGAKKFLGADFTVKETWEITAETLNWKLEIVLGKGARARSLLVRQHFPYRNPPYGTGVWAAHWQYPTELHRVANNRLAYGDVCFGTLIPAITLYLNKTTRDKKVEDVGLTIAKPFGLRTSRLFFNFMDYHSTGVYLETEDLGLRPGSPARTSFMIHPHEGDWRPGLGWLYKKYPEYFDPPNKKVREAEGGYIMTSPNSKEKDIKEKLGYDPKWTEIHGHFIHYGQYAPVGLTEWGAGHPVVDPKAPRVGIKKTNKVIEVCNKHGIRPLPYFQCAGDGHIPYVTKKFPKSIAKDSCGKPHPVWIGCYLMNSDPKTKFGKEMLDMVDRFVAMYPNMGGVFVDQLCYDALDTAHDDGVTMYKNKPAYRLWHCYEKPLKKLADIMHGNGKILFSNGPCNIEVQKEIDGHMAEGLGWVADALKYLCVAKPLLFLVYAKTPADLEGMFLNCLISGASYSIHFPKKTKEIDKIYKAYIPLVRPLYGRRWLLEPNPIAVPEGMDGNIFKGEKGTYVVTLVSRRKSILEKSARLKNVKVRLRFEEAKKIKRALTLGAGYKKTKKAGLKKDGNNLTITIPEHLTATTVILEM